VEEPVRVTLFPGDLTDAVRAEVRLAAAFRFFAAREILFLPSDMKCRRLACLTIICGFCSVRAADREFILAFARMTESLQSRAMLARCARSQHTGR